MYDCSKSLAGERCAWFRGRILKITCGRSPYRPIVVCLRLPVDQLGQTYKANKPKHVRLTSHTFIGETNVVACILY